MSITTITMPMPASITAGRTIADSLEAVIERGLQTFVEVGAALKGNLRAAPLPRAGIRYVRGIFRDKRWGWSRETGYKYIHAAEVHENVYASTQTPPSLGQARELASLPPEQQREVASRVDFANTTVRELKEEIRQIKQPQRIAVAKPVAKPTPIVRNREIRKAHTKDSCERLIGRIVKAYERYHNKVDAITILHLERAVSGSRCWSVRSEPRVPAARCPARQRRQGCLRVLGESGKAPQRATYCGSRDPRNAGEHYQKRR